MNGFVPTMLAVLLAEFGPRAAVYADARRLEISLWVIVVAIAAAGAGGAVIAPTLTGWANAFLIGIALFFAAYGQLQRVKPASGLIAVVATFWRGGVLLIVFAFATRFGVFAASFGALAGLTAAAVLTRAVRSSAVPIQPIRWGAAIVLAASATFAAVGALRLA